MPRNSAKRRGPRLTSELREERPRAGAERPPGGDGRQREQEDAGESPSASPNEGWAFEEGGKRYGNTGENGIT